MFVLKVLLLSLFLTACGGGGSGGGSSNSVTRFIEEPVIIEPEETHCISQDRNCSNADVDLNAPVRWAADNGISIVHIRWAGCSDEKTSKYAFERGVTIICIATNEFREITANSKYTITVSSSHRFADYGPGIDYTLGKKGTIHSGIWATALVSVGEPVGNYTFEGYSKMSLPSKPVMIVDNGFDHRPLYVLHKNPMLAGEITGDYGVKALNELSRWVDVDVIGYVPFNTMPKEPRIDNWKII